MLTAIFNFKKPLSSCLDNCYNNYYSNIGITAIGVIGIATIATIAKKLFSNNHSQVKDSISNKKFFQNFQKSPIQPNFIVHCNELRGFGDLSHGINIAKNLKKLCPKAETKIITNDNVKLRMLDRSIDDIILPCDELSKYPSLANYNLEHTLVIQTPYSTDFGGLDRFKHKWRIPEYSLSVSFMARLIEFFTGIKYRLIVSGLAKKEIGVVINEELVDFYKRKSASKKLNKKVNVTKLLESLESKELKNCLITDKEKRSTYFGYVYSYETALKFLTAICAKETKKKHDIDLILPGKWFHKKMGIGSSVITNSELRLEEFYNYIKNNSAIFKKSNIKKVKFEFFYRYNINNIGNVKKENYREIDLSTIKINKNSSKTLRIIFPSLISHEDMITLFKASKNFTCITGDQSLVEAISAHKCFLYEELTHKKALFNALNNLWRSLEDKKNKNDLLMNMKISVDTKKSQSINKLSLEPYINLGNLLSKSKSIKNDFALLSKKIINDKNYIGNFTKEIRSFIENHISSS